MDAHRLGIPLAPQFPAATIETRRSTREPRSCGHDSKRPMVGAAPHARPPRAYRQIPTTSAGRKRIVPLRSDRRSPIKGASHAASATRINSTRRAPQRGTGDLGQRSNVSRRSGCEPGPRGEAAHSLIRWRSTPRPRSSARYPVTTPNSVSNSIRTGIIRSPPTRRAYQILPRL
jgi:hypothetical protein